MAKMDTHILLGVLVIFCAVVASDKAPVLIWSNDESQDMPSPLVGHSTTHEKLWSEFLDGTPMKNNHNIIIFLQDKLSLDDITQHADVFGPDSDGAMFQHLKDIMETHQSTHFPSVSSPGKLVEVASKHFDGSVHEVSETADSLADVPLSRVKRNLVLVHLPKTRNAGEKVWSKIDGILGRMTDEMKSLEKPFTALYTGQHSSAIEGEHLYQGRHLLAANTSQQNYTYINVSGCILFYYTNLNLSYGNSEWTLPQMPTVDSKKTVCNNESTATLVLNYAGTESPAGSVTGVIFQMEFVSKNGMWWLDSFNMSYSVTPKGEAQRTGNMAPMNNRFITPTPNLFSYHCYQGGKINETNGNSTNACLQFTGLQVQAVKIKGVFGYANDCVGFFTITIWSGIIVGFLLIGILTFGILMLMNISTMDRFDDPKGKSITVNVME